MNFTPYIKEMARHRQWGKCVVCGDKLGWQEDFAHHISPSPMDGRDEVRHCAVLCKACNEKEKKDGKLNSGFNTPESYLRYWNG